MRRRRIEGHSLSSFSDAQLRIVDAPLAQTHDGGYGSGLATPSRQGMTRSYSCPVDMLRDHRKIRPARAGIDRFLQYLADQLRAAYP